jgi:hypothetical protein
MGLILLQFSCCVNLFRIPYVRHSGGHRYIFVYIQLSQRWPQRHFCLHPVITAVATETLLSTSSYHSGDTVTLLSTSSYHSGGHRYTFVYIQLSQRWSQRYICLHPVITEMATETLLSYIQLPHSVNLLVLWLDHGGGAVGVGVWLDHGGGVVEVGGKWMGKPRHFCQVSCGGVFVSLWRSWRGRSMNERWTQGHLSRGVWANHGLGITYIRHSGGHEDTFVVHPAITWCRIVEIVSCPVNGGVLIIEVTAVAGWDRKVDELGVSLILDGVCVIRESRNSTSERQILLLCYC